jgi:transcriptional regulator with XRE-family HTH domain
MSTTDDMKKVEESDTSAEKSEHRVIGARLREAREFLGLNQEDVTRALGIPRASVSAMEAGKRRVTGLELRRLARLYRRTTGWLLGAEETTVSADDALFRATAELSENDRSQVLKFAEFLASNEKLADGPIEKPGANDG